MITMGFFEDAWKRSATYEGGEMEILEEDLHLKAFEKMQEQNERVDRLPNTPDQEKEILHDLYDIVLENIQHYVTTVNEHVLAVARQDSKEEVERVDEVRGVAHNALLNSLDALERNYKKYGLDKSWRSSVGYNRDKVREWASSVMKHLRDLEEERRAA